MYSTAVFYVTVSWLEYSFQFYGKIFPKTRLCVLICLCVPVQSVHPQLYIKGEGSAGKLQHQEQE